MKTGNQAEFRRYLESEHGKTISKQRISQLCKENNYRIHKTAEGRIKFEKTAKALLDSGFGKKSDQMRIAKGEKVNSKNNTAVKKATKKEKPITPTTKEIEEDIENEGPLKLTDTRERIELHKSFHQSEKERINNEIKLEKLIDVLDVGDRSFNLWRQVRDAIQAIKDRCSLKLESANSSHEIEQILNKETHKILSSIVSGYKNIDDDTLKKKLVQRLIR